MKRKFQKHDSAFEKRAEKYVENVVDSVTACDGQAVIIYGTVNNYTLGNNILWDGLNNEEKNKANAFKFEKDKRLYVFSHFYLKMILAINLKIAIDKLEFETNEYQKPELAKKLNPNSDWHFNLSHSGEVFAFGICRGAEIGVDIEEIKSDFDFESVLPSFHPADKELIQKKIKKGDQNFFYEMWTKREAVGKFKGTGLSHEQSISSIDTLQIETQKKDNYYLSVCTEKKIELFFRKM